MKPKPTGVNKITRPTLPPVYPRTRLFRLLDQAQAFPITWISGPPGSGKTTLIANYLDQRKLPCLWYRLDEGDQDLATFFYYLGLAGQKANPRSKKPLPLLTPEYQFGIPTFTRRYFENLYQRLRPPYVLVFDNYQMLPAEASFHNILCNGFYETPPGIRIMIVSRTDPVPAFVPLQANNLLHTLDWEELRLSLPELKGLVKLHDKKPISQNVLQFLHTKTQGWAAGVILLEKMGKETLGPSILDSHIPETIFDYFAGEIFNHMDAEMRTFLLQTACFPRMTPLMAERLTGNHKAGRILAELNRKNYFIEKRIKPELTYQYHALFREFLQSRQPSADGSMELCGSAANILEQADYIEDAVELYCQTRNWDKLKVLIQHQGLSLAQQGRHSTLDKWLTAIPAEIAADPWMAYWNGVSKSYVDPQKSQASFEQAYGQFRARRDAAGAFLSWVGVMDVIAYAFEDLTQYDHWIPLLDELLREFGKFPSSDIEGRVANAMITAMVLRQPSHPAFASWMEKALVYKERKANTLFELAFLYIYRGDFRNARRFKDQLHEIAKFMKANPLGLVMIKLYDTIFFALTGFPEQCIQAAHEGLELADKTGMHLFDIMLLGNGAFAAYQSGDLPTAQKFLTRLISASEQSRPWEPACFHFTAAVDALLMKDLLKAQHHAELNLKYAARVGVRVLEVYSHFLNAVILNEQGEYAEAEMLLEQGLLISKTFQSDIQQFEYGLIRAYFNLSRRQDQAGLDFLKRALAFGKEKGIFGFYFTFSRRILADLCIKALEAEMEVDYVRELIRRYHLAPEAAPLHLETWPWLLKIYTLGRFGIIQGKKPAQSSRKAQHRPLLLLKTLIALGGREIAEDRITNLLWPDADGDLAHQSFESALHRLRKLLGSPEVLVFKDSRLSLDNRLCWVDAWAFERLLGQADHLHSQGQKVRAGEVTHKAVNLYRGAFLAGDNMEPWMVSASERLRNKYFKAASGLGRMLEAKGRFLEAVDHYGRMLELDDCREETFQRLMTCHAKLGQISHALAVYQRCSKTLSSVLGIAPSPATETIRASLFRVSD